MAFHDVRFPPDVSYGASGGPRFRTVVVGTESGYEQRIGTWSQPRLSWQVGHNLHDVGKVAAVLAFFRARRGRLHSFRFKDWSDYTAGMVLGPTGWAAGTPEALGTGDGVRKVWQLTKRYTSGATTEIRTITKPVTGTVRIYVGGVEQTAGWTVDGASGLVTFADAPPNGQPIGWVGEFDIPARFDTDEMAISIEGVLRGEWPSVPIIEVRE